MFTIFKYTIRLFKKMWSGWWMVVNLQRISVDELLKYICVVEYYFN